MITRRSMLRIGGLTGLALLPGCGFQPLYGNQASSGAIAPELGAIEINEIGEVPSGALVRFSRTS